MRTAARTPRRRSSLRIVWPACFDAQVANVHQLADPPSVLAANSERQLPVALRDLQVPQNRVGGARRSARRRRRSVPPARAGAPSWASRVVHKPVGDLIRGRRRSQRPPCPTRGRGPQLNLTAYAVVTVEDDKIRRIAITADRQGGPRSRWAAGVALWTRSDALHGKRHFFERCCVGDARLTAPQGRSVR